VPATIPGLLLIGSLRGDVVDKQAAATDQVQLSECFATFQIERDSQTLVPHSRLSNGRKSSEFWAHPEKRRLGCSLPLREIMSTERLGNLPATERRLSRLAPLVQRIEGEYHEMPGLKLTEAQAQRLWALDPDTCHIVLVTLMQRRFLRRTATGMYVRAGA
jgi:hypothetical protein